MSIGGVEDPIEHAFKKSLSHFRIVRVLATMFLGLPLLLSGKFQILLLPPIPVPNGPVGIGRRGGKTV
ncbi:uncharacterized protein G2W53_008042 [Senna tora]|uniref:Uncharacterized protein n=1 Tax=Senna tora TaxID=362788 RepID=A0A834X7R0_9FABA|nr:uncharacterized protein G2W53_008042 [Senna tora]